MTVYPGTLDTFTTKTNKQDSIDADHMNDVQAAIVATQTELGVDVAGSQTNLVTRLARSLADNGAMRQGTSFPGSPNEGDFFYRTDENVMYIYNGATWDSQGQSLSNVVFSFSLCDDYLASAQISGVIIGTTLVPAATEVKYLFWGSESGSGAYNTVIRTKFKKLAGMSTVTCYARIWNENASVGDYASLQVDIDSGDEGEAQSVNGTAQQVTPEWVTVPGIDVSAITDGEVVDVLIGIKNNDTAAMAYLSTIIGIVS